MFCNDCHLDKSVDDFVSNRGKSIRRCKSCSVINLKATQDEYYERHKEIIKDRSRAFQAERQKEWNDYLQSRYGDPSCQLCDKSLVWPLNGNGKSNVVHFDHRHNGSESIKIQPSKWMRSRHCTDYNKHVFEVCDFGILCNICNCKLPTLHRDDWLRKAMEYHGKT